ncbi:MAG: DUF4012 domain-containing protein [Acidimicrobiia bacterium]|nr:DUF4012 domain-containing protein [Acidimicrobiia bacterium]
MDDIERHWWTRIVAVQAVLSGGLAVLAGASPVGSQVADVLISFAVGAAVVPFFAQARRWSWLLSAGLLALAVNEALPLVCAVGAVVLAFAAVVAPGTRMRIVGGLIGLLVVQAAFRQDDLLLHGMNVAWAVVALAAPVISGFRVMRAPTRRVLLQGLAAVGTLFVLLGAVAGFSAFGALGDLREARSASEVAFDALRAGEQDEAAEAFERAAVGFDAADGVLGRPWVQAARIVPVVGQQVTAASTVAAAGGELSEMAASAVLGARYSELRPSAGSIDLAQVEAMQPVVRELGDAMADAQLALEGVDSPWLLPGVGDPLRSATQQLADSRPEVELADDLLMVLPAMLGGDGPRYYLALFATPSESRFQGGFVGGYGVLEAVDGQIDLIESGRISELGAPSSVLTDTGFDPDLANRYQRWAPERFLQNTTVTPDFPTNAELARRLAPQFGLGDIDGVIYVDPVAIAAMLELTGPVDVDGLDEELTADNAAELLLRGQYERFDVRDDRSDLLADAAEATFEALTERDLPGPGRVAEVLGPMVEQGRVLLWTGNEDIDAALVATGLLGALPRGGTGDFLSFRVANSAPNKLDTYLSRTLDYDVAYEPRTGRVDATLTVRLHNAAPTGLPSYASSNRALRAEEDGAPPDGTIMAFTSLYSGLDLDRALVGGRMVAVEIMPEFGHRTYSIPVEVPRGQTVEIVYHLDGSVERDLYTLDVVGQPLGDPEMLNLAVRTTDASLLVPYVVETRSPGEPRAVVDVGRAQSGAVLWEGPIERPMRFLLGPDPE